MQSHKNEGGRTVDVMRFLVTYGLDAFIGSVENKPCLNRNVKESVRKLLKEVAEFSTDELSTEQLTVANSKQGASDEGTAVHQGDQIKTPIRQGDWTCPKCNFLNFARNVKCLRCGGLFQEKLRKLNEELEHLPLKKGDWICNKCNFLNFAKNTRCLQCNEKPPQRQLNPGEWECESCNYINFKRNMVCLKCDHKRPKAMNSIAQVQASQSPSDNMHRPRTRPFFGQEMQYIYDEDDKLNFVDGDEVDISSSFSKKTGLNDFPIIGGKSELSQNVEKQERWRKEMAEQNRSAAKAKENANEFKSSIIQPTSQFLQSSDDEDMAEWFGYKKEYK